MDLTFGELLGRQDLIRLNNMQHIKMISHALRINNPYKYNLMFIRLNDGMESLAEVYGIQTPCSENTKVDILLRAI